MIRRRCQYCGAARYHLHTPATAPDRYRWGPHSGAATCADCGRSLGWLRAAEAEFLRAGVYPEAARRFEVECGGWVAPAARAWAVAALARGVPNAPEIETGRDLAKALAVACTLPKARQATPRLCQRLAYALAEYSREAEVWCGVVMAVEGLFEVVQDSSEVGLPFGGA